MCVHMTWISRKTLLTITIKCTLSTELNVPLSGIYIRISRKFDSKYNYNPGKCIRSRAHGEEVVGERERERESEQREKDGIHLKLRVLCLCTGTPSSSVTMTEELLESERRCLLRIRKSSNVGVVGS